MFAVEVNYEEFSIFRDDGGMFAGHAGIGDDEIAIDFAANGVGSVIQRERLLIVSGDEDDDGKDAGNARV